MSQPWHRYVFNTDRRAFVGEFESMYQAEAEAGFDSWHQSDPRRLDSQVAALLLQQITFHSAIDLGCGKGLFTASLARRDNRVVGVDISQTAIATAQGQFPDLEWACAGAAEYLAQSPRVDLVLAREVLSYLEDWREVLARCAEIARYVLVG